MKLHLFIIIIGILSVTGVRGNPEAKITFGTPHKKVFPADESNPESVCIELTITITNTSTNAIGFRRRLDQYVKREASLVEWSDITRRSCPGPADMYTRLKPGESKDVIILIDPKYGEHHFMVKLGISDLEPFSSDIIIKSQEIILPRIEQAGAGQPATRSESKGSEKSQSEAEIRTR